jgi:hypothetical protein
MTSVAFDIPLAKNQTKESPPPVQKRLENNANSPRKSSFSIADIVRKLTDAGNRRENVASASKAKASAHNEKVKTVVEAITKRDVDTKLESRIASKLESASVRREDLTAVKVEKLAEINKDKIERGTESLLKGFEKAKGLEKAILLKEQTAEMRREQLIASKVNTLAIVNESKEKRGQLALELSDVTSQHKGNLLEQKLASASHRREMSNLFKSIDNGDLTAIKQEKALEVKNRDEALASSRAFAIDEKIKAAEERRAKATLEAVNQLSEKTKDKLRRGAEALEDKNQRSKALKVESQKKVVLAEERRIKQITEQQELSSTRFAEKEAQREKLAALEAAELKLREKALRSKLLEAELRKEELLYEKSTKIGESNNKKNKQSIMAKKMELEEAAQLKTEVENKIKSASARKDKATMETRKELYSKNNAKVSEDVL